MLKESLRLWLVAACALLGPTLLHAGSEGDPNSETPLASRSVRIGAGSVDAVSGNLLLRVPIGPRLPGRFPIGFTWSFDNQDGLQSAGAGGPGIGGQFRPVVWPSGNFGDSRLQTTVCVEGESWAFQKNYSSTNMSSTSSLMVAMTARGVSPAPPTMPPPDFTLEDPGTLQASAIPSSDGTKLLVYFWYNSTVQNVHTGALSTKSLAPGYAILDGPKAIWMQSLPSYTSIPPTHVVTHFTNLWGDHVTVDETHTQLVNGFPVVTAIQILDTLHTANSIALSFSQNVTPYTVTKSWTDMNTGATGTYPSAFWSKGTLSITNTLGLPSATLPGYLRTLQRVAPSTPYGCSGYVSGTAPVTESIWDNGFAPTQINHTATDGNGKSISLTWPMSTSPDVPWAYPSASPTEIDYPNGMKETFTYAMVLRLSKDSYSKCTGVWAGFSMSEPPTGAGAIATTLAPDRSGVTQIIRQDTQGSGQGESIVFLRKAPVFARTMTGPNQYTFSCTQPDNVTAVLHYPTSNPDSGSPFRAIRFTHPSYNFWASAGQGTTGPLAYLFATSAILFEETINGSGIPTDPSSIGTPFRITQYDGFDLTCWANPTGALSTGLPTTAFAERTVVYNQNLPTHITVTGNPQTPGSADAYGPILTDEYTDGVIAFPTVSGTAAPMWSSALPASESHPIHRRGLIQRQWDTTVLRMLTKQDQKTIDTTNSTDANALSHLRFSAPGNGVAPSSGISSVDFGPTSYGYSSQGLITSQQGSRTAIEALPGGGTQSATYSSQEVRSYVPNPAGGYFPILQDTTKTLTSSDQASYAGTGTAGKHFTWTDTHLQGGPSTAMDKLDGRTESYQYDPNLGRETSHTDVLGITTSTSYDAWGRAASVTRGGLATSYTYDSAGRWKKETTTGQSKDATGTAITVTRTTETDMDAFGRTISVKKYAGGVLVGSQSFVYDGFGQILGQSPWLLPGMTSWGYEAWTYDDKGRVTAHYDRAQDPQSPGATGRLLNLVTEQPEYVAKTIEGQSLLGQWTTTVDDRGRSRSEAVDLLGQKIAVVNQKGQLSRYWYDQDGHLLETQQGSQFRTYTYNLLGWLTSRTEPEEGRTTYSAFTVAGSPLQTVQVGRSGTRSNTFSTTVDSHLMPTQVVTSGPEGSVTRTLIYNSSTRLLTSLSETQAITGLPTSQLMESYTYNDPLFRLTSKTIGDGGSNIFNVSRSLDDFGNELSLTYPGTGNKAAQTVTTGYDAQLRPTSVGLVGSTRGIMSYDSVSGTAVTNTLTFANGASTVSTIDKGELIDVMHKVLSGLTNNQQDNQMAWTPGGLLTARGTDSFQYDELQRLSYARTYGVQGEDTQQWFLYDRGGNRIQEDYLYNGGANAIVKPDELIAWRTTYATNDLPGSVTGLAPGTAQASPTAGTVTGSLTTGATGSYDDLGRMTQVWAIPGQTSSLTQWVYDPSGRVVKETVNGVATRFLLDAEGLRFERIATDGTPIYTVYGFHREPLAQYVCPLGNVHTGSKAVQIFHKTGTNSALSRYLGSFAAGDTVTASVWVYAPVNTLAQVFLGNVTSNGYTNYDNSKMVRVSGTGAWQQVTITWTMSHADWMWFYIYGDTNGVAPDLTSTNFDDVAISSTLRGSVFTEGFEGGLTLGTSSISTTGWFTSGEPTDVDIAGQTGMAEWQKSMVYGFGQLLSEDQLVNGTIYIQSDQVGSPNIITNASGAVISRSKNLPFGERFGSTGTIKSIRRFTNHEDELGSAIYMQARTYLPAYGKFAQVDPVYDQTKDDPESWNLYSYTTNNPVTHTDPDGRRNELHNHFGDAPDAMAVSAYVPANFLEDGMNAAQSDAQDTSSDPAPAQGSQASGDGPEVSLDQEAPAADTNTGQSTSAQTKAGYSSPDEAAKAGFKNLSDRVGDDLSKKEFAGYIFKYSDGSYGYTQAFAGNSTSSKPSNSIDQVPDNASCLIGTYHNHPKDGTLTIMMQPGGLREFRSSNGDHPSTTTPAQAKAGRVGDIEGARNSLVPAGAQYKLSITQSAARGGRDINCAPNSDQIHYTASLRQIKGGIGVAYAANAELGERG